MTLPGHLIDAYWDDVTNELLKHDFTQTEARSRIAAHRRQLAEVGVDEWIYHWDAIDTAKSILASSEWRPVDVVEA